MAMLSSILEQSIGLLSRIIMGIYGNWTEPPLSDSQICRLSQLIESEMDLKPIREAHCYFLACSQKVGPINL
jgi:hypothetical protein